MLKLFRRCLLRWSLYIALAVDLAVALALIFTRPYSSTSLSSLFPTLKITHLFLSCTRLLSDHWHAPLKSPHRDYATHPDRGSQ
jgi:hypothetical protein